jgi:AraC family transcriptional activator of pobA
MALTNESIVEMKPCWVNSNGFEIEKFSGSPIQQLRPYKPSSEDYFTIILFYTNKNSTFTDTESNHSNSGFLVFKSPGESNAFVSQKTFVSGYYIQFTEEFLLKNRQLLSIITGFPFFEISLLKNKALKIDPVQSESITDLYIRIHKEYNYNKNNSFEIVNIYLQALLLKMKTVYETNSDAIDLNSTKNGSPSKEIFQKFKTLVWLYTINISSKQFNRKTVTEYADLLFVHPNYLYAVVKKETGKTAREYIDEQMFKLAKSLLLQTELQIKEIAWQLSFSEPAHFCNFFRRQAGIPPNVFRRQYVNENTVD